MGKNKSKKKEQKNNKNKNNKNDNKYEGFKVPFNGWKLDVVSPSISPEEFFKKYIATRTPVIIGGFLKDEEWKGQLWTNEYLKQTAGEEVIEVENRSKKLQINEKDSEFGLSAPQEKIKFEELLTKIEEKNENYYLTTQHIEEGKFGFTSIFAPPVYSLRKNFPLTPLLLGNLIPYQMNMWMGYNNEGTSSGLHHDYHDNIYILLRGKKRFTLFAPSDAPNLYCHGDIDQIHPNGFIQYKDHPLSNSDGSLPSFINQFYTSQMEEKIDSAERELIKLKEKLSENENDQNLVEKIAQLNSQLTEYEEKLEDLLDHQIPDDNNDDFDDDFVDDFDEDEDKINDKKVEKGPPSHFSKIDNLSLHSPSSNSNSSFPLLEKCKRAICTINQGQMLYLPAGWFHEVTSFGSIDQSEDHDIGKGKGGAHLAFNYWVYPPNKLDKFEEPYENGFWREWWSSSRHRFLDLPSNNSSNDNKYNNNNNNNNVIFADENNEESDDFEDDSDEDEDDDELAGEGSELEEDFDEEDEGVEIEDIDRLDIEEIKRNLHNTINKYKIKQFIAKKKKK